MYRGAVGEKGVKERAQYTALWYLCVQARHRRFNLSLTCNGEYISYKVELTAEPNCCDWNKLRGGAAWPPHPEHLHVGSATGGGGVDPQPCSPLPPQPTMPSARSLLACAAAPSARWAP
ncbi:hypothetical protein AALO_G00202390 [Alosa alosa]|uniref:Uncharacterized protein n=1 Tax=Alosa alosa TaxID=278164 RepID=A0AAV6G9T7_9TELE|nr:hypothetical protein AALO_G00202390 [Alosa alosa]